MVFPAGEIPTGAEVDLNRSFGARLPGVGWQRNLYALTAASFLLSMGFVFVMPLLPLLMAELVGDTGPRASAWSGLAFAVSPLMGSLVAPLGGRLGDQKGQRLVMLQALFSLGVLMGLMGLATSAMHLVLLRGGIGALGAFSAAAMAAIAATAPKEVTARSLGLVQTAQVAGSVIGPLIAGLVADRLGLHLPFVIVVGIFGSAFLIVFRFYRDAPAKRQDPGDAPDTGRQGFSRFWFLWIALFTVQFADATFGPLLPLYIRSLGAPAEVIASLAGVTVSLGALGWALSSFWAPRLREGRKAKIIQTGLVAGALLNLPVAVASSWWQLMPLRASLGLVNGAVMTLSYTVAAERAGRGLEGAAMAGLASAGMIGWASGAMITGVLASAGPRVVFGMDIALFGICAIAWLVSQPLSAKEAEVVVRIRPDETRVGLLPRQSGHRR